MNQQRSGICQLALLSICIATAWPTEAVVASKPQEANDAAVYHAKGLTLSESGHYEEAVQAYKQAIKLKPAYAEAHYNLGEVYFILKQYKKAVDGYKLAIRYKPDWALAHNNMGSAYYKLGEQKKAVTSYQEAIRLNPRYSAAYYNLGAAYLGRNNQEAALEQYKVLKTFDPQMADKLYVLIYQPMATVFDATGIAQVRLNVAATNSQSSPVEDLKVGDFRVFEDGEPQSISFFSQEKFPLVYGLVVDNSGSFLEEIYQAIEISKAFIQSNQPQDETSVVRFINSDKIETAQDFTPDKALLNAAVENLYIEPGQSAILDAVYLSAQHVAQYKATDGPYLRRAVILISDGDERTSYYSMDALLKLLRQVDVQVFVISLIQESRKSEKLNQRPQERAVKLLTTLAKETGGQAFFPKSVSELPIIVQQITRTLRTQYVIGYKPTKLVTGETYRTVTVGMVEVPGRDKLSAVARTGYITSGKQ